MFTMPQKPTIFSYSFCDEEEFSGVAEPNSNIYSSDSIYLRPTTPQRIPYV